MRPVEIFISLSFHSILWRFHSDILKFYPCYIFLYLYILRPIHEIAHFIKYARILPISWNRQLTCLFHEKGNLFNCGLSISRNRQCYTRNYKFMHSSINIWASGDSPLAQLVKELDLCLCLCITRRLWVGDTAEPFNSWLFPGYKFTLCHKIYKIACPTPIPVEWIFKYVKVYLARN